MSRAENAYWKKKLPPGFRYMLEKIGRGVCKGHPKPANVVEYIATYLEFKQSEHAAELAALPQVSYVQKLLAKKERKEASNIAAEQREGARTREEAIQAASAIAANESRAAESKKETDTRTSENVLVKRPAPGGDDNRRSATKLPQAQKSVIEILYPNTSTGKIIADHKKGQVRGASQTSREEIRKETSNVNEIGRQRTSDQYLRETSKGSEQQIAESKSVIKTPPSELAVKSVSQPVVKVPSETFAPLVPNDRGPSQLIVKNPSPPAVKVPSKSAVKDQSHSLHSFTPHTCIEPSVGREQEEQAGTSVVLIDSQKEVARVSHQQTVESLRATKSPSQPTVKVSSHAFASQAPIVKSSSQLVVKSPSQPVVKVSSQSPGTEQEEPAKETVAQIDAQGEVALVSQQQIAEALPSSKLPSQITIQFRSESFSQQAQIEKAPAQPVLQAPLQVIVKSPSQPAVNCPSRSAVKVSTYSVVPQAPIEPSTGGEQESLAEKTVVQIEPDKEVAHASQVQIVESVITKKSPSKQVGNVPSQQFVKVPSESLLTFPSQPAIRAPSELAVKTSQTVANVTSQSTVPKAGRELEEPAEERVLQAEVHREVVHVSHQQLVDTIPIIKAPSQSVADAVSQQEIVKVPSLPSVKVPSHSVVKVPSQPTVKAPSQLIVNLSQPDLKASSESVVSRPAVESAEDRELEKPVKHTVINWHPQAPIEPSAGGEQESLAEKTVIQIEPDKEVAHASQVQIVESVITKKSPSKQVGNVPSQQFVKVPSESLLTFPSQPAIRAPSELAVKTSQTAANVTSQPTVPKAGRELEEPAEERVVQAEVHREVVHVSHQQLVDTIPIIKAPSQSVADAVSQQEIVKVPSLPSVKVPSHSVVKVPSQPTVKAPSQLIVNLSQPDLKASSESVVSRPAVESAEDRELEKPVKHTVIQTEVQKEIALVSHQQVAESISTVKTPSQPVVKAKSQQVIHVPLEPAVKASSQQIVKDSHSVDKAPSQQAVKASSQTAVKTSHPNVKVPSQSFATQAPVNPTAGREPEEAAKETIVAAELQRNVTQVSQQQITESTAKTPSQKVLSQSVVKSSSRPAVKATSQQIVKVASHSVVKASSQPTVKAPSQSTVKAPSQSTVKAPSQPAVKTSQPAVKISSQRIATRAPIEQTSYRELKKPAKETVLLVDNQRELSQVSQQQIAESIPATKAPSQPVVKTISQPIVKSTSRPSVKAASQYIVKGPSLSTVKVPSHSVVKAPSHQTVKVPSQLVQSAADREMDEPGKETVARVEVQMEITQVSQQQIAESVLDGNVKARSQPAIEVPSQSAVKISSQLIASQEPMELSASRIQVESAGKTIIETEDSLRMDIPGQLIEETNPLEETEVESVCKTEEFVQSPLDQPVIISTQAPVAVAESPANELKAESELVKLTEQTLAETVENVGIPEVIQTGDERKVFGAEIDLTFEAETVSSLVAIKAEAEEEKEVPLYTEVDREERKELITYGDVPAHEHLASAFGDLADETQIPVLHELDEGTGQEASLQKTKASVSHLSLEEACVQEAKSNEPDISSALLPTEDTDAPVHAYDKTSEVPASHVATEEYSVSLHEVPFKELEDSSHLSSGEAYAPLEEVRANESAKPQTTEAFVEEPETASLESSAEKCKEELSEISKVIVCQGSLSIELNTIEADIQEVSETYNADVCQRRFSIDPTTTNVEDQVEVSETSKVAVHPRRLSIDQTATEVEGEVEVSETSKDSVCQKRLPLDADIQEVLTETCKTAVCQKTIPITEAEADVSKDPCNIALCQRKLSVESTNTEIETQAEVSEMSSQEPVFQALWPPTEELATLAEISETLGNGPNVPIEESECYVPNVPAENEHGYIQKIFLQESELLSSHASLEESTSTAPVLEVSSQEHESLASNVPSEELQMPVMKTCSNEPKTFPPSEEPIAPVLEVPSEEPQVSSHASEPSSNEVKAPIHSV